MILTEVNRRSSALFYFTLQYLSTIIPTFSMLSLIDTIYRLAPGNIWQWKEMKCVYIHVLH